MYKILFILPLVFVLNCKTKQTPLKQTENTTNLIGKGSLYGAGAEGITAQKSIITNQNDWNALLSKINTVNNVSDGFSETDIDFKNYNIIAVFETVKSSGGYSIDLDVVYNTDAILVSILSKAPKGMATSVMNQPYCIVKLSKSDLPVVFKIVK